MIKATADIKLPDGKIIKKGEDLPYNLIRQYELSSPHLLDCYEPVNAGYYKKIGKKLIPHSEVLRLDLVEKIEEETEEEIEEIKEQPKKPKKKKK